QERSLLAATAVGVHSRRTASCKVHRDTQSSTDRRRTSGAAYCVGICKSEDEHARRGRTTRVREHTYAAALHTFRRVTTRIWGRGEMFFLVTRTLMAAHAPGPQKKTDSSRWRFLSGTAKRRLANRPRSH